VDQLEQELVKSVSSAAEAKVDAAASKRAAKRGGGGGAADAAASAAANAAATKAAADLMLAANDAYRAVAVRVAALRAGSASSTPRFHTTALASFFSLFLSRPSREGLSGLD
jgi:TctA family transporter